MNVPPARGTDYPGPVQSVFPLTLDCTRAEGTTLARSADVARSPLRLACLLALAAQAPAAAAGDRSEALRREARAALDRGDFARARQDYLALALQPDDAQALREAGRAAHADGDFAYAEQALARADLMARGAPDPKPITCAARRCTRWAGSMMRGASTRAPSATWARGRTASIRACGWRASTRGAARSGPPHPYIRSSWRRAAGRRAPRFPAARFRGTPPSESSLACAHMVGVRVSP